MLHGGRHAHQAIALDPLPDDAENAAHGFCLC
jgi:hypothetical protein